MRLTVTAIGERFAVMQDTGAGAVQLGDSYRNRELALQAMIAAQAKHEEREALYRRIDESRTFR